VEKSNKTARASRASRCKIEHADFSFFVKNPQILQHYLSFIDVQDVQIAYVVDTPGLSKIDVFLSDGRRIYVEKAKLYPILKELQQQEQEQGGAV